MTSREHVLELAKSLTKAQDKSESSDVLSILESLEEVEMTIKLLKDSKLGRTVNDITKSVAYKHDKDIQATSKRLVSKWKEMVASKSSKKRLRTGKPKRAEPKSSTRSQSDESSVTTKSEPASSASTESASSGAGYLRADYDWSTGDRTRDKMISKFISVLKPEVDTEEYCCFMKVSADIEEELGALYGSNTEQYIAKYRDLHFNLKRNGELCTEILLGHITAEKVVGMTSEELADKCLKEKREKDKKWALEESRNDHGLNMSQSMTEEFKCGKCKMRKCKYSQAQTRGADEPMTTFVTCLNCGNRWKF